MKKYPFLLLFLALFACNDDENALNEFTGNIMVYNLSPESSHYNGSGTVTFKERVDQGVTIEVAMDPTGSGGFHPMHLHYGTFDNPDAEMAAILNPVDATNGESSTTIYKLLDETKVTYMDLVEFDGSIKIHLDDGPNKKVVIAAANIGLNASSADISDGLLQ
jgi:hypothetical protein